MILIHSLNIAMAATLMQLPQEQIAATYAAVEVDPSEDQACKPTDVIASAVTTIIVIAILGYNKADRRAYRITTEMRYR